MSDDAGQGLTAEAEGASLGEAKWNAVKALEPRFPGVTGDCVSFEVLAEGDEGADQPARVRAALDEEAYERIAGEIPETPAERVRAVVSRVVAALGLHASVDIEETGEEIRATVNGDDLGLLIGRHGATIDALQHLAMRAAFHSTAEHKAVVVDAAGYRERRAAALKRAADRAVEDALSFGRAVELEPMGPQERRIVHVYLRDRTDVQTHSEGDEPDRRLVVTPVKPGS
ncbi:MAG TPA: R3H domain-containing nucleic acid-binding protein [Thermoleophilaceae bacterium]|nr:R3H domain-containing nucleic acid-binding protein [Thermoleophilaceae bacterium]